MSNSHRKRIILETCAMVAESHGKIGEPIAAKIRAIDVYEVGDAEEERSTRYKYLYRQTHNGRNYIYFRLPNGKLIRLPDNESSAEFRVIYSSCLKKVLREKRNRQRNRSAG
jgi:hypothetical protein